MSALSVTAARIRQAQADLRGDRHSCVAVNYAQGRAEARTVVLLLAISIAFRVKASAWASAVRVSLFPLSPSDRKGPLLKATPRRFPHRRAQPPVSDGLRVRR